MRHGGSGLGEARPETEGDRHSLNRHHRTRGRIAVLRRRNDAFTGAGCGGCWSVKPERLEPVPERLVQSQCTRDVAALLADGRIDVVVVDTPVATHVESVGQRWPRASTSAARNPSRSRAPTRRGSSRWRVDDRVGACSDCLPSTLQPCLPAPGVGPARRTRERRDRATSSGSRSPPTGWGWYATPAAAESRLHRRQRPQRGRRGSPPVRRGVRRERRGDAISPWGVDLAADVRRAPRGRSGGA